ncbi:MULTISPECIES: hypothetical protein [Fusobacterium]|jgi:hypothetical protein|uniref:hypothetical protein n=1 Tax=Fusobacterium TaxID=848 RepID=UPI0003B88665|nr:MULTISPECIES: hypothetical protein [Fusobacterium]ERT46254.1 hypothetical protein HMPREF1768_00780 [Fusobacterium nucleatum CTI-7]
MNFNSNYFKDEKKRMITDLRINSKDIVYLSGSLIEGIGNSYSDLDIFIVTKDIDKFKTTNYDYSRKLSKTIFKNFFDKKCDIEIYDYNLILRNIFILNNLKSENYRILNIFEGISSFNFFSFIHRLLIGVSINNSKDFLYLKEQIDLEKYFIILKFFYQNSVENLYDDLVGNIERKNYLTVKLLGNMIIPYLISYYLCGKKISIDRVKWSILKLENLSQKDNSAYNFFEKIKFIMNEHVSDTEYGFKVIKLINDTMVE